MDGRGALLAVLASIAVRCDGLGVHQTSRGTGPAGATHEKGLQVFRGPAIELKKRHSVCDARGVRRLRLRGCAICRMTDNLQPTLYARERSDGCGARLHDIIMWAAVAAHSHMNFGGVISTSVCQESHGADIFRAVGAVLGLRSPQDLFTETPPAMQRVYKGVNDFNRKFVDGWVKKAEYIPGANVLVGDRCISCALDAKPETELAKIASPKFLRTLRNSTRLPGREAMLLQGEQRPLVAIHVRRGDVTSFGNDAHRLTADEWYFEVVEKIREQLPTADVQVFSSTERQYDPEDFDGYRKRGMTVHLDGDILEPWAAFARADVLVMAKSSFSHVGAFLNDNCVIYQPYWHRPLKNWIVANNATSASVGSEEPLFSAQELRRCLASVARRSEVH